MEIEVPVGWQEKANILKVVGVGGGGTNAVSYMYQQGIKDVDFIVCNTDFQHLKNSPVPRKLQLGLITCRGLGAGTDPLYGKKAAIESHDQIEAMLGGDTEMVFITCGMGGGTGTGAAPIIAEVAKEKGLLTVGVVTLPFRDEGPEALYRANEGIKELNKHVDSLLIIDNQKIYEFEGADLFSIFPKADEVLATAVKSIAEIITSSGYINVDFADVRKVMQDSGMALMGQGRASGVDRVQKAIDMAFKSPLLSDYDLKGASRVLVNISSSTQNPITTDELSQIMDYIKEYTGNITNFKRGVVKEDSFGEDIGITIIATGFSMGTLPQVDPSYMDRENLIIVDEDAPIERKSGLPLNRGDNMTVTKKERLTGIPALIVHTTEKISEMENEPAYTRRARMLIEQKKSQNETEHK